jgi:hypothetical protein
VTLQSFPPSILSPLVESAHYVGAAGEPAFTNGWSNYDTTGASWSRARFWKTPDGIVHLGGLVTGGVPAQAIFTLPVGYRPLESAVIFMAFAGGGFARLDVFATGVIYVNAYFASGTNAYLSLDGITFQSTTPVNQSTYDPSKATFYGTTPPLNPSDGTEWVFPADPTLGVNWRFRYRSGQTLPWEFVGGTPLAAWVAAEETQAASTVWANLTTPGPTITLPRTGDYDVEWGYYVRNASAGINSGNSLISRSVDAAGSTAQPPVGWPGLPNLRVDPPVAGFIVSSSRVVLGRNNAGGQLVAGDALQVRYYASVVGASGIYFGNRWMRLRPVRVV